MKLSLQMGRHSVYLDVQKVKKKVTAVEHKVEKTTKEGEIIFIDPEIPNQITNVILDSPKDIKTFNLGEMTPPSPHFRVDGKQSVWFHPGVTVMFGAAGTGKTVTTQYMVTQLIEDGYTPALIRFGEPELTPVGDHKILPELDMRNALLTLGNLLVQPDLNPIFFDSVKELVYAPAKAAAGKGGMNMGIFNELTRLSAVAAYLGKALVITMNPLTADTDLIDMYREAMGGSVTTLMMMNSVGSFSVSSRYSENDISGDRSIYQININHRHLFDRTRPSLDAKSAYIDGHDNRQIGDVVREPLRPTYVDKMKAELEHNKR